MDDPYLDELKKDFRGYSTELKKLKQKLLKSTSVSEQSKIIKKIDVIASKMENNQKQATKVKISRLRDIKKNKKQT